MVYDKVKNEYRWLEWCPSCKRKHVVKLRPCPSCGIYLTPQPASDWVIDNCSRTLSVYECDGCESYREHLCFCWYSNKWWLTMSRTWHKKRQMRWTGPRRFDYSCANHRSCTYCRDGRLFSSKRQAPADERDQIEFGYLEYLEERNSVSKQIWLAPVVYVG